MPTLASHLRATGKKASKVQRKMEADGVETTVECITIHNDSKVAKVV